MSADRDTGPEDKEVCEGLGKDGTITSAFISEQEGWYSNLEVVY
jgi:hypothetical protein